MILDQAQIAVENKLQKLSQNLENSISANFLKKFLNKEEKLKSLYIYGDVGRGKSMLMKKFYNSLQKTPKIYFHFNSFMRKVHENLRDIRKEEKKYLDELIEALKRIIKDKKVICFDEFQVLDIADAMLLSRIFSYVFSKNILVIFTSNSKPLDLYKNGLQREVFLEFVREILLKNCEVLFLDSATDYRQINCNNLHKRYFISNQKNREIIEDLILGFTKNNALKPVKLQVWGREIILKRTFARIAVINFDEICRSEFFVSDYQAICQNFDLIFLLKVPQLNADEPNEAKRFMLFIDEVYENKVALIILAKIKAEEIYVKGSGAEAFKRTVSRLKEIKSDAYWKSSGVFALQQ